MTAPAPSVLLIHEFAGSFGGAERYLELLGAGLRSSRVPTSAVVFAGDGAIDGPLGDRLRSIAPDTAVLPGRSRPGPIRAAVARQRPDVLHWTFVDPFAFRGASWLLLPWGRPSVITDHLPQLRHAGPHWETTRRLANRRIAVMIVVGEVAAREAERRWRRPPPLAVVANGVPAAVGRVREGVAPDQALRLLFLARLTEQKGADRLVPDLVAARGAGVDARLRIVGEGPMAAEVADRADRAGVAPWIELAGFSDDPAAELAAADVLVAPSRYEGLPFTPLEALSSGLPLVLSDIGPHRELAGASAGPGIHLVDPEDGAAMAAALKALAADLPAASADALARSAEHGLDRMIDRTVEAYRRAVR